MKKQYFFLLGERACHLYEEDGFNDLLAHVQADQVDFYLTCYDPSRDDPCVLVQACMGHDYFCELEESEYKRLLPFLI